ncbi:MAG: hypothetical protein DWQ10_05140 [Calditrichaeota bacterium]|nr:MAG: hypothetical protein DWQ10_05140 [Calditrichota bacterium]
MRDYGLKILSGLFLLCLILRAGFDITAQEKKKERLELIHADDAESYQKDGRMVRKFTGGVIFSQGEMKLFCDALYNFPRREEYLLLGHVRITDADYKLKADSARYFTKTKIFQAYGNVELLSDGSQLDAKLVTYFQNEKRAVAEENVKILDHKQHVEITGERAELERRKNYTKISGDPVFIQYDSAGREEMRIIGESMESFEQGKRFEIKRNVKITRDSTVATCQLAMYHADSETIELQEEPVAINGKDKITGEKILLHMLDKKLQSILVSGKLKYSSLPDSSTKIPVYENYLTGQSIQLFFTNNEVNKVQVSGTATSVYHVVNEQGIYQGENWAQGDTIIISIVKNGIDRIKIKSAPGSSQGKFTPPEIAAADSVQIE